MMATSGPPELTADAIVVDGITKRFGSQFAVDGLSFTVKRGQIAAFLGRNGAGKTTTLRMLVGLTRPSAGTARFFRRDYRSLADPVRLVGTVLEAGFHPARTASDHLRILALAAGLPRNRVSETLEIVGLTEVGDRRVGEFSFGMRQRLNFAAALLGQPEVLVLDEPANGLDPQGIRWLRRSLEAFADAGGTVLLSSHLLSEVALVADVAVIIDRGRLVYSGPLKSLGRATPDVRVRTACNESFCRILVSEGLEANLSSEGSIRVANASAEQVGQVSAAHGIVIHELGVCPAVLEDVFLSLTSGRGDV